MFIVQATKAQASLKPAVERVHLGPRLTQYVCVCVLCCGSLTFALEYADWQPGLFAVCSWKVHCKRRRSVVCAVPGLCSFYFTVSHVLLLTCVYLLQSGTYTALNGSSSCTECAQGAFQPGPGQTACDLCPKG